MDIIINLANSGEYKHLYNAIKELETRLAAVEAA